MSSPDRPAPRRVLIVDDSPFTRGLLSAVLRQEGYEVEVVEDGAQALLRLHSSRPDVILLDLAMPVMDGWEFLRRRKEDPAAATVPVIILSATDEALFAVARDLGARCCLKKPWRAEDVLAAVRQCAAAS